MANSDMHARACRHCNVALDVVVLHPAEVMNIWNRCSLVTIGNAIHSAKGPLSMPAAENKFALRGATRWMDVLGRRCTGPGEEKDAGEPGP